MSQIKIRVISVIIAIMNVTIYSQNVIYNFKEGEILRINSKEKITKLLEDVLLENGKNFEKTIRELKSNTSVDVFPVKADSNLWYYKKELQGSFILFEYNSDKEKIVTLNTKGDSYSFINGEMRSGNKYQYKDKYESWQAKFNYHYLPVKLKKGKNYFLFYCARGYFKAELLKAEKKYKFNGYDVTLPDLRKGEYGKYKGAIVVNNYSEEFAEGLIIQAEIEGKKSVTELPKLLPLGIRKVIFYFEYQESKAERIELVLKLVKDGKVYDEWRYEFKIKDEKETYKRTFISEIDGSLQYYAINPALKNGNNALFLSLHGADVEAINQAGSYFNKSWADIVAPTNRRPFGFNWEFWGRIDAMEVLQKATEELKPDEERIYLIGHSMGGHGTWNLGATYPDKFAGISPSAGWISLWSYPRSRVLENQSRQNEILNRGVSPSLTLKLRNNYKQEGIYIIHGLADKVVKPDQAEEMIDSLKKFHKDFDYHFEPDAGHWWDRNKENGADCVDWQPMFDFMARHSRSGSNRIRQIDFTTASPSVSSKNYWVEIFRQIEPYKFSNIQIRFYDGQKLFKGKTENIDCFGIDISRLPIADKFSIKIDKDSIAVDTKNKSKIWFELFDGSWKQINQPDYNARSPLRNGTLKEAFNHNVVFVYGTNGNKEANRWTFNKAKYDAEYLWYQGNASIDVISDKEFLNGDYSGRNIIIYGNKDNNMAWRKVLKNSPVIIIEGKIAVGDKEFEGEDYAGFFVCPVEKNTKNLIGVVAGSGEKGRNLTLLRNYFSPIVSYPDFLIIDPNFIHDREKGIKATGFYDKNWEIIKDHSFFN